LSLLWPAGLFGLFGLLVPLLVHLQRQIQRTPVRFAALRWLSAAARPRQRLRLQQWPLLLARMALVIVATLLLAQPLWFGADQTRRWVLVHPQLERPIIDVADADVQYRWLAPGFAPTEQPAPAGPWPVASLIREFDAELPVNVELEVRLPEEVDGLDGERMALSRELTVSVVDAELPKAVSAREKSDIWSVRSDSSEHPALRYINAATAALSTDGDAIAGAEVATIKVDQDGTASPPLPAARALIWLSDAAPTDQPTVDQWLRRGGVALWLSSAAAPAADRSFPYWRSVDGVRAVRAQRHGAGWLLQPNSVLRAADFPELLEPDFPRLLHSWLDPAPRRPGRALASDLQPRIIDAEPIVRGQALDPVLLSLLLALLLTERAVAALALRSKP